MTINIDVDVSKAITGLKAVQREAKETIKVLKELDGLISDHSSIHINADKVKEVADSVPEHDKRYREGRKGWTFEGGRDQSWFNSK